MVKPTPQLLSPLWTLPLLLVLLTTFSMVDVPVGVERLRQWQAGTVVDERSIAAYGEEHCFVAMDIPDSIFRCMVGKTYRKGCSIARSDLRYLRLLHRDAKGRIILGEMVCHRSVAEDLTAIFRQLYHERYPIERMRLADVYDGDDNRSMVANNTSCFNFRRVQGSTRLSAHSRGMAVDINPLYTPVCGHGMAGPACSPRVEGNMPTVHAEAITGCFVATNATACSPPTDSDGAETGGR